MKVPSNLARLAYAYVALMALWLLLRGLLFDAFWPLALVNTMAEYLFLPLPLLLLAGLCRRRWDLLLALALPASAFLVLFGDLLLPPRARPSPAGGQPVTAMTLNILYANEDHQAMAGAIRAASPDVVGLQELWAPHPAILASALQAEYPYRTFGAGEAARGVGLLSRFPVESAAPFPLPPLDLSLHAVLRVDGRRVHVFVVHLSPNNFVDYPLHRFPALAAQRYASRRAEVRRLDEEIQGIDEPVLLLCDCNMTDTSETYARLSAFLRDSYREAGWGFGHTLRLPGLGLPVQRLDYVWHSEHWQVERVWVGPDAGSDHLPVVARLTLMP